MELEIDRNSSKEYYSEVLAVMSDYRKLINNPRRKLRGLKTQAMMLMAVSVVFLVIFAILYIMDMSNTIYFYVVLLFIIAFVLSIVYNALISRRISRLKNKSGVKKLIIANDYVEMKIGDESTRLSMFEIEWIIINRYSIAFLPKDASSKMIAVDVFYKDKILGEISNKDLIADNSGLY